MRARPQRIRIERGGATAAETAEVDPAAMPGDVAGAVDRLLDELRTPAPPDAPAPAEGEYDVVLDYGNRQERLRYDAAELPGDVREALDAVLRRGS